jgi:hypothetical protein
MSMANAFDRNNFFTRQRSVGGLAAAGFAAVAGLAVLGIGADYYISTSTVEDVTFTVTKSERVTYKHGDDYDSKYLIWTTKADGTDEVFEDTDTMWFGKFNSSDLYGKLKPCHTFNAQVNGWRMPMWSTYRNILKAHDVTGRTSAAVPEDCKPPAPGR